MGEGLSPALMWFPSGPKAPLTSDLEFIQDNSLLLPPVPAPSAPGLLAQGGRSGLASLCPDPKGGKKWLEMGISERKAFSSLTFAAGGGTPKGTVLLPALLRRRHMNSRPVPMGGKGKAASPLKVGLKAEHSGSEHVPALSADAEVEGA